MMRRALAGALALIAMPALAQDGPATPTPYLGEARIAPTSQCASMLKAGSRKLIVEQAENQAAGPFTLKGQAGDVTGLLPAHCVVRGVIEKRTGADGQPYGIRFELRLPTTWNGRFLFQGGGGINGVVNPALGSTKGPWALARGFAVVTQDAGHSQRDASFGADSQARIDMIYRSYVVVTAEAKKLIEAFYARAPQRSYFMGCSEGGREAMFASQRMAMDYDGIVAGDPGFLLGVSFDDVAGRMAIARISPRGADGRPDLARAFSAPQLALLNRTVAAECDGLDGLADGIIDNAPMCRPRLERLACRGGKRGDNCLSRAQIGALRSVFDGGLPSGWGIATKGYYFSNQLETPFWRDKLAGFGGLRTAPVSSIQGLFVTPYQADYDDFAIDFAKDGPRFAEVGGINRTDGVSYSTFAARGSKLLLYKGVADPGFSAKTLVDYYERLTAANGGREKTSAFARLFLAPGMLHCRGGKALDDFDPLGAVVEWVEEGRPPKRMIATGRALPGRSRPICPFPKQSRYRGSGSIEDAGNFECRAPANAAISMQTTRPARKISSP